MFEVHSYSKPGRPVLLILAAFVVLCGTLGLAWVQSVSKRSLGPARNIAGTPLIVRPPHGWSESSEKSGFFYLADRQDEDASDGALERQISFRYLRLPRYVAPEKYIEATDTQQRALSTNRELAKIRGIRAVQVRRVRIAAVRGHKFEKESVLRVACHPRGDVIIVEYAPMTELTRADFQLFDAVCDSIDFNDPEMKLGGGEAQSRAGLKLAGRPEWSILGPQYSASPVLHVLGGSAGNSAHVEIARTWRSDARGKADLLRDSILSQPSARTNKMRFLEWVRRDGVQVVGVQMWPANSRPSERFTAYAVSRPPADLALVLPDLKDPSYASLQIAEKLAASLDFSEWAGRLDLEAARKAGERLVAETTELGAMPWWGEPQKPYTAGFHDRAGSAEAGCVIERKSVAGNRERGFAYSGAYAWADLAAKRYIRHTWTLDSKAVGFQRSLEFGDCVDRLGLKFQKPDRVLWEKRDGAKSTVWRRDSREGLETESEYPASAAFVAPPIEDLIAARAARGGDPAVMIEVASRDGANTHARLLIPLGTDDHGAIVLIVDDYSPQCVAVRFDGNDQPAQFVESGLSLDRLAPNANEPLINRLRAELHE